MDLSKCETLNPIYNKELRSLELHLEHGKANEMGSEQLFAWEQICEILEKGEVRSLFTTSQRKSRSGKSIFIAGANVTERSGWTDAQVKAHVQWQREVLMRLRRVPCSHSSRRWYCVGLGDRIPTDGRLPYHNSQCHLWTTRNRAGYPTRSRRNIGIMDGNRNSLCITTRNGR